MRSVSFSDGRSRDLDMIFRDRTFLVFCFCSSVVTFQVREANSWQRRSEKREIESWQLSLCAFSLSFFSFLFFLSAVSIFSRSNSAHSRNKGGTKRRGKAERRQIAVRFTRFVDYRVIFDSGLSFSLEYDLIRSAY